MSAVKKPVHSDDDARFSEVLPYRAYDDELDIYVNAKSVMVVMELELLSGANRLFIDELLKAFNDIHVSRLHIRVTRYTLSKAGERLDAIRAHMGERGGVFEQVAALQDHYFRHAIKNGIAIKGGKTAALYDSRIFVELTLPCVKATQEKAVTAITALRHQLTVNLTSLGCPPRPVPPALLLGLLRGQLAVTRSLYWSNEHQVLETLNEQVLTPGTQLSLDDPNVGENGVVVEKGEDKCVLMTFGVQKYPSEFHLWDAPDLIAPLNSSKGDVKTLQAPHVLSYSFQFINDVKAEKETDRKWKNLKKNLNTKVAEWFPAMADQYAEWHYIRERIKRHEIRLVQGNMLLTVQADYDQWEETIADVSRVYEKAGFTLSHVPTFQLPLLLANLPATQPTGLWGRLKLFRYIRRFTSFNAVNLLPIVGDWKGTYVGDVMPSSRGQLAAMDLFGFEGLKTDNKNFVVTAYSGSGKSVWVQTQVHSTLARDGTIYIIDKGDSYKKMCSRMGGVYINAANLSLNPFTYLYLIKKPDELALQLDVIAALIIGLAYPQEEPDGIKVLRSHCLEAVKQAYFTKGVDATIDDVISELNNIIEADHQKFGSYDRRVIDLVTILKQYATDGNFGRYFNEKSDIDPNAKMVVLELGSLDGNEDLQQAVLMSIINLISQRMYQSSRDTRKMCIIDEAWDILGGKSPQQKAFVEKGFRTSRKHGGAFGLIMQNIGDYFDKDKPVAQTCWGNAAIKIIMRQEPGTFKDFRQEHPGCIDENEAKMIANFPEASEVGYSTFLLKAGDYSTYHRLYLQPQLRLLYSTDGPQFQYVDALENEKGLSTWQACYEAAWHFYPDEMAELEKEPSHG